MDKRAVIYTRVSTDEQAEKGYGLESQRKNCIEYAERHDLQIVDLLEDQISGTVELEKRPQGKKLYEWINSGKIENVIFARQDRVSRESLAIDFLKLVNRTCEVGITLHFADQGPLLIQNNVYILLGQIAKQMAAGEDRKEILKKMREAKEVKAIGCIKNGVTIKGRMVMTGYPPYGYRRNGKGGEAHLLIDEYEASIVRSIFEWYTTGNGNGPLSLRAIASRLEGDVPTPHKIDRIAKKWHATTIRGILMNEIYVGRTHYQKTRGSKKQQVQQPREKWIPIDVPELAIIDRHTFNLAQEKLERNKELQGRDRNQHYLLSSFFRCGACNSVMGGNFSGAGKFKYRKYRCGTHWRTADKQECPNLTRAISAQLVENKVWAWITDLLEDEEKLDKGLRELEERKTTEAEPMVKRLEATKELIDKLEQGIKRLAHGMKDLEDDYSVDTLKGEMKMLSKQRDEAITERQRLEAKISGQVITADVRQSIIAGVAAIRRRLISPTYQQKRDLLELLDFQAIFRIDEAGRWLDVSCGLKPEGDVIELDYS